MKRLKKHLIASIISFIIGIVILYIIQNEYSVKVNTLLAGLIAVLIYWRVIQFYEFKEKGSSSGLAFYQTVRFIEPPEGFVQSTKEKKKEEADDLAKQLFSSKRK